ncbi:hypothetical protein Bca4012_018861 [Brassica carinata]
MLISMTLLGSFLLLVVASEFGTVIDTGCGVACSNSLALDLRLKSKESKNLETLEDNERSQVPPLLKCQIQDLSAHQYKIQGLS